MADIKIATYSDIINAGGKINSGINYTSTKCVAKNAISNFSNVTIAGGGTSKLGTRLININEFTIVSTSATLTSISTNQISYEKGSGGSSAVTVLATYSDGTTRDVTVSCTITITNASVGGVANWNSSTLTITHGNQGTATLNVSYTEGDITKTTTAPITTTPVFPIGYTIIPSSVTVEVGKTVNVSVTGHLNNDNNALGGFTYSYEGVIPNESSYFSFNTISGGVAVSGIDVGRGNIMVGHSSGLGATIKIPVTVIHTAQLVIYADTSISKGTSNSNAGSILFKIYDINGNELSSTDVTNDCILSVDNDLLTVTKNGNALEYIAGNNAGTSIITATYTYNGAVYTNTHTVSITDPAAPVTWTSVSMIESQYSNALTRWLMEVKLSDGSTVYPPYTATCTMSQADSAYVGMTFDGPLAYEIDSSGYKWAFNTISKSAFYDANGRQIYPVSSGSFNASTDWRLPIKTPITT